MQVTMNVRILYLCFNPLQIHYTFFVLLSSELRQRSGHKQLPTPQEPFLACRACYAFPLFSPTLSYPAVVSHSSFLAINHLSQQTFFSLHFCFDSDPSARLEWTANNRKKILLASCRATQLHAAPSQFLACFHALTQWRFIHTRANYSNAQCSLSLPALEKSVWPLLYLQKDSIASWHSPGNIIYVP